MIKEQQQALFFRQLAATVKSGVSLGAGVRLAAAGLSQRQQATWQMVVLNLERGQSLRAALKPIQAEFAPWAIALLIMAAESGAIAEVCSELAEAMLEMAKQRRLLRGLVLRLLRMFWSWLMVIFLLTGGVAASAQFWLVSFGVAIGLVLLTYLALNWRPLGDRLRFIPPFKVLFELQTLINLGYLQLPLDCGVSIGAAIAWLQRDFPDPALSNILKKVEPKIRRGISLYEAMQPYFSLMILQMIQTGEEAGSLGLSFEQIRHYHQRELRRKVQLLNLQVMFVSLASFAFLVVLLGTQVLTSTLENLPTN
ncbi:MAG: type II secretion system F family protein [Limnothrix sp.]